VIAASPAALVVRADAQRLPLPDGCVDLVVTSPPYWQLRAYATGHPGELGSEPTPAAYLAGLWAATGELARVLKPSGSIFVNLGDCYADRANTGPSAERGSSDAALGRAARPGRPQRFAVARKSLYGLPWCYALGCTGMLAALGGPDPGLGLILRAELVWAKPSALPESVTDRVLRTHETWFHLVKTPRYYAATDELRRPHAPASAERAAGGYRDRRLVAGAGAGQRRPGELEGGYQVNPAGALPGSVWTIPSEPLRLPAWLGVEHYAAFGSEWPRRLILGWSPPGICLECGTGRVPVVDRRFQLQPDVSEERNAYRGKKAPANGWPQGEREKPRGSTEATILGYACAPLHRPSRQRRAQRPGRPLRRLPRRRRWLPERRPGLGRQRRARGPPAGRTLARVAPGRLQGATDPAGRDPRPLRRGGHHRDGRPRAWAGGDLGRPQPRLRPRGPLAHLPLPGRRQGAGPDQPGTPGRPGPGRRRPAPA